MSRRTESGLIMASGRGRVVIAAIVALALVVIGVVVGQRSGSDAGGEELLIVPRAVERRDLDDVLVVQGVVRRNEINQIVLPEDGRVGAVAVAAGDIAQAGDTLFTLNGRAAVAVNGDTPFYRRLDIGSRGPDVAQLEQALVDAGYPLDAVDTLFDAETRRALAAWQRDRGYAGTTQKPVETLTVVLGQNPAGYSVGTINAVSYTIVPRPSTGAAGSLRRQVADTYDAELPGIEVTLAPGEVDEGDQVTLRVLADPAPTTDITVVLDVAGSARPGSSAARGADYPTLPRSVVIPAGDTEVVYRFRVFDDEVREDLEDIVVSVATPLGSEPAYRVGIRRQARVGIRPNGDDLVPVVVVESSSDRVVEGGVATFTFTSSIVSSEALDLDITLGGSATVGLDYATIDLGRTPVSIPAGARTTTLQVFTRVDDQLEIDETVVVSLRPAVQRGSTPVRYIVGTPGSATVTIESLDLPELRVVGGGEVTEGDRVSFTIVADRPLVRDTSVVYQFAGTATPGVDFEALPGTVVMAAGTDSVSVELVVLDDDVAFLPGDMVVANWPARVGSVNLDEGALVARGTPVLSLTEATFSVRLSVSPSDRSQLVAGQRALVKLGSSDVEYAGVIAELDDSIVLGPQGEERYEGVVTVEGELDVVDGARATIDVVLAERLNVLVVPVAAVLRAGGVEEVRVVNDRGTLTRVPVTIGLVDGEWAEVTTGLVGNELVVVDVDPGVQSD